MSLIFPVAPLRAPMGPGAPARNLAAGSLHIFLERYGTMLEASDLENLASTPAAEMAEAQIWLERLRREPPSEALMQKKARRRRWARVVMFRTPQTGTLRPNNQPSCFGGVSFTFLRISMCADYSPLNILV